MRLVLILLWLFHWLPLSVQAAVGDAVGALAWRLAGSRRRVTLTNLALCFPELSARDREAIGRAHFAAFARGALEQGIMWWGSAARIHRTVRLEGTEHWQQVTDRPVILFAPHFVGLNMGAFRIGSVWPLMSVYSRLKNPVADAAMLRYRLRFDNAMLFSRQDSLRPLLKALKPGTTLYYLPDQDFGPRDALFVPFFGVPAATVPAMARIARITGAAVVPCITRQLPGGAGYVTTLYPAWEGYPTDDLEADTRRMNAFLEDGVREMPAQYFWSHKRFKTRPAGEASFYSSAAATDVSPAATEKND
jgi:KDO2-lipid IV(A) lauroyltransferase